MHTIPLVLDVSPERLARQSYGPDLSFFIVYVILLGLCYTTPAIEHQGKSWILSQNYQFHTFIVNRRAPSLYVLPM